MKHLRLCAVLLTAGCLLSSCKNDNVEKGEKEISVRTMKLGSSAQLQTVKYIGVIEEDSKVNLSFKTQGTINRIFAKEGQYVKKGDLLASLDTEVLQQNFNMANESFLQAEDAYKRMKLMYDNNSLAEIKFIEVQTGYKNAKSNLALAKENLSYSELFAPVDGVIGKRFIEKGENVMGTQTAFTILSIGNVKAKIAVPENEIPMLSINDKAVVEIPVLGKDAFVGNIIEKGVDGNKLTHTYDVKISLNNSEHKILPGMVCNISIAGEETSFFVLPNNSIQIGSNNDRFVWCMKNGKATAVKVTLGELTANGVMVVNGLSQNDIVIIEGMQKVSEGMNVRVL